MQVGRREATAVAVGVVLVVAAFVVPHLDLGIVTPLINATPDRFHDFAGTAPIFGWWNNHVGWGTVPAVVIGAAAVLWGQAVAQRLPWRWVPWVVWATACAWAFSLAMVDGWERGFAGRLTARHEYLRQVPTVTDIPEAVRTFAGRILDYQPDSWITHVSGHPPGALLTFVWLDRIGLSGGAWAALLCLLVGSSAAAAIVVAVRALVDENTARMAAPFVAVAPTAIWIAVSADGYFAGVAAWGIALLALAVRRTARWPMLAAAGSGLLLGWGIFLNYGLGLMALPAVSGVVRRRGLARGIAGVGSRGARGAGGGRGVRRRRVLVVRRLHPCPGTLLAGHRQRPPVPVLVVGELRVGSVCDRTRQRRGHRPRLRPGGDQAPAGPASGGVRRAGRARVADLSMLSKAETERIWLPFTIWLTAAAALLPPRSQRWWLAVNVVGALLLNHLILTNW